MIDRQNVEILVVEDSALQAEILRRKLVDEGYQVTVVGDGAKALVMIRKKKPALIISDVVMPIMDGYKMCHEIKYDEDLKDIPVILLTDLSDTRDVIKGLDAKGDYYVTKPYDNQLLLDRIDAMLSRPSTVSELAAREPFEIEYGGETHVITSGRREILNFLISTYENAVHQNRQLLEAQDNLKALNQELDLKLTELQESDERFSVLVQMIPDIVYRIDSEGKFVFVNDAVKRLGFQPENLIGKHFSEIILPADVAEVSRDQVLPQYEGKLTEPEDAPKLFDERRTGDRVTKNLEIRLLTKGHADMQPAMVETIGKEVVVVEVNSSGMYEVVPGTPEKLNAEALAEKSRLSARIATETIDGMMDAVLIISPDGRIIQYNHGFAEAFGWGEEVLGDTLSNYVTGVEVQTVLEEIIQGRFARNHANNLDCQVITRDRRKVPALINATLQQGSDGTEDKFITVIRDITERKQYEEALQEKSAETSVLYGVSAALATSINPEEIFAKLFTTFSELDMVNAMKMGYLFVVDDGFLRLVPHPRQSPEFIEIHRNLKVGECLCGLAAQTGELVICQDCAGDERAVMRCHDGVCYGHVFLPLKNMEEVKGVLAFTCSEQFHMDENKEKLLRTIGGLIGVALDNASLHEKSRVLSLSDPLTGIANRRLLDMMLDRSLARSKRYGEPLSVVMVDIDYFKKFNDTHGHVEGDRLLCQVAKLFAGEIRQTDLVARYGGEEFLIMLPDANLDNGSIKAERIRQLIADTTKVTISLGVACYQDGIKDKEDLINRADKALYAAKEAGRNQVRRMDEDNGNRSPITPQTAD